MVLKPKISNGEVDSKDKKNKDDDEEEEEEEEEEDESKHKHTIFLPKAEYILFRKQGQKVKKV